MAIADLDPALRQLALGVGAQFRPQLGKDEFPGMDQHQLQVVRAEVGIETPRLLEEVVERADGFDAGESATRHHHAQ